MTRGTVAAGSSSPPSSAPFLLLFGAGCAASGAALALAFQRLLLLRTRKARSDPETNPQVARDLVWASIGGAMNAAMVYAGDHLRIYSALRVLCAASSSSSSSSYATAVSLAEATGYDRRWLREWLAQQAAMGILRLLPGDGDDDESLHYRLPAATAEVLANPDSKDYDVAMVQMVPALVNRAKTMLPEAFSTGLGRPYDDPDVAEAIDRQHRKHVRDTFIPKILRTVLDGDVAKMLERGCKVSDLGCGAGIMLVSLARAFPNSTFHGYEVSKPALDKAAYNLAASKVKNVFLHNANEEGESLGDRKGEFNLCVVYDVLHDCTNPADLIRQVKVSLKPVGVWLLADIPAAETIRKNLEVMPAASTYLSFSTCLCMSCSLSEKGGAGLGTLGFSIPVAKKMLTEGGFRKVEVITEVDNARWFLVQP
jgi:2-polyprenyl-3-methyl-5-hydroxy-6-metoxy-1,4-benzoquinol methylase